MHWCRRLKEKLSESELINTLDRKKRREKKEQVLIYVHLHCPSLANNMFTALLL